MIAILMDAHYDFRLGFFDNGNPALHILHLFIGSIFIVQAISVRPRHNHFHIFRFQEFFQLFRYFQVDVFFQRTIDAHLARIRPSMPGIDYYAEFRLSFPAFILSAFSLTGFPSLGLSIFGSVIPSPALPDHRFPKSPFTASPFHHMIRINIGGPFPCHKIH